MRVCFCLRANNSVLNVGSDREIRGKTMRIAGRKTRGSAENLGRGGNRSSDGGTHGGSRRGAPPPSPLSLNEECFNARESPQKKPTRKTPKNKNQFVRSDPPPEKRNAPPKKLHFAAPQKNLVFSVALAAPLKRRGHFEYCSILKQKTS